LKFLWTNILRSQVRPQTTSYSLLTLLGRTAWRAKIRPDEDGKQNASGRPNSSLTAKVMADFCRKALSLFFMGPFFALPIGASRRPVFVTARSPELENESPGGRLHRVNCPSLLSHHNLAKAVDEGWTRSRSFKQGLKRRISMRTFVVSRPSC
jgi:hypothetical protein